MEILFKTYFLIFWGLVWGLIYIIWLLSSKRNDDINSLDFGAVLFSAISIIGGFKLIWLTLNASIKMGSNFDTDKIYTAYGGICVIWISIRAIYMKLKNNVR